MRGRDRGAKHLVAPGSPVQADLARGFLKDPPALIALGQALRSATGLNWPAQSPASRSGMNEPSVEMDGTPSCLSHWTGPARTPAETQSPS